MKKYIFIPEHLLLLCFLPLLFIRMFMTGTINDVHFHDTYFAISPLSVYFFIYFVVVPLTLSYLFHLILRAKQKTQHAVSYIHIVVTIVTFMLLLIWPVTGYTTYPPLSLHSHDPELPPSLILSSLLKPLFVFEQGLFIGYSLTRYFTKPVNINTLGTAL